MQLVTVKTKYQIVIPRAIREQAGVGIGDLLEAKVEKGKITFAPKSVLDRHLAEGLEDLKKGLAAAGAKYPWLDTGRSCALGASYGGYMMNWI